MSQKIASTTSTATSTPVASHWVDDVIHYHMQMLRLDTVCEPRPRFDPGRIASLSLQTLYVQINTEDGTIYRTTRLEHPIASLLRLHTERSGHVFITESFSLKSIPIHSPFGDDDEAMESTVQVSVSIGGQVVRKFDSFVYDREAASVTPQYLIEHSLHDETRRPDTPYVDLFEWLYDLMIVQG